MALLAVVGTRLTFDSGPITCSILVAQGPPTLKSTIMSLWLLTVFFGNMLDAVITKINIFSGLAFFLFFASLMFLVALGFIWAAFTYQVRDYSHLDVEVVKPVYSASSSGQAEVFREDEGSPERRPT